jgi:uncharacterized protein
MTSLTAFIGTALSRWVRIVLRFRLLVIGFALICAALSIVYSSTRLGINTDTADMISAELPWRQHFIEFRESFAARDRNIAVVVSAPTAEQADAFTSTLVARLEARPDLFMSVFAAGAGEFFERHGLLYLPVERLEELADNLAAAQPLLGQLRPRFDGSTIIELAGRTLDADGDAAAADALYAELAAAVRAAAAESSEPVEWRALMMGEAAADGAGDAAGRRIVVLRPALDFDRVQPAEPAIDGLRAIVGELAETQFRDVSARLTGSVAMEHEEMLTVRAGAGLAALASLLMVGIVLYAALRSLKLIVVALVTLAVGLTGTAAFAAAAVGHLNLLSVAFAVLYVGLGVDFIFHFCLRVKELLVQGLPVDEAIAAAAGGVGTSLVICTVTTAAGFYAFIPTDFDGVSELGLISGTGMFVSLFVSFTLLPALLGQLLSERDRTARRAWLPARGFAPLASRPRVVVAVAALLAVGAAVLLPRAEFNSNPIHLRDPDSESVRALEDLADDGQAPLFDLVAIAPDSATAERWAAELRDLPEVRSVATADALVPDEQEEKLFVLEDISLVMGPGFADVERGDAQPAALEQALTRLREDLGSAARAGDPPARALADAIDALFARLDDLDDAARRRALRGLDRDIAAGLPAELDRLSRGLSAEPIDLDTLPAPLTERWIAQDGRLLIQISPSENVNDNDAAARFVAAVRGVVPSATGLPVVYQEASRTVVRSFQLALTYALVLVATLLFVFLRRLRDVLLVILPIGLACIVTAAATVLLDMPFNFANIITLPLLVGIGVDNGIHIVHRMRSEPPPDGQPFGTSTSLAVLASGLTTVASFGNLGFSAHQGMASMGQLLALGMALMLAATLVLLPAMLKLGGPR